MLTVTKRIDNWYFEHIVEIAVAALVIGVIFGSIALSKHIVFI
jgi:hypothetical protein